MSMDSSGSSSNIIPGSQIRCFHNEIAPLRVIRHQGPRCGKRFYGCSYWPRHCGFFRWADEINDDVRTLLMEKDEAISELQQEKKALEKMVKDLTLDNKKLEEDFGEVVLECEHRREVMCAAEADKRMGYYLAISWMLFAVLFWFKC